MKKLYLIAATAAMFAACTSNDKLETPVPVNPEPQELAISFDAYTNRGVTRAGVPGDLTDAKIKDVADDLGKAGFGVFAYYTDLNEYDQLYTPNFMYNQQVKYDGANWIYEPLKYWPNEYGNSAISDDVDKVSFFAYAPYVDVSATSGKVEADKNTWGITGMTKNSATGDPIIKYIASFDPTYTVDLCWGVVADADKTWNKVNGGSQTLTAGLPWINVERPADATAAQKMKFTFKHALSQLQVKVDAAVDALTPGIAVDGKTKIYVRSISFTGIAQKGALNLNNTVSDKALWLNYNGTDELDSGDAVTIHDGLKDGKEGTGQVAANEKLTGLAAAVISDAGNTTAGVTKDAVNLFANTTACVIPTGENMTVTICYDVETEDDNLAGYLSDGVTHGSSIQNVISKEVNFGTNNYLENGKKYILYLHLGMNSVKFDAAVTAWDPTDIERDVELPFNALSFASGANGVVNIDAATTSTVFYITGQDRSAAASSSVDAGTLTGLAAALDDTDRATSGFTKVTADGYAANTTTSKKTGSVTVKDAANASSVITINQAGTIGFTAIAEDVSFATNGKLTLTWAATDITSATDMAAATNGSVKVYKNGELQTVATNYTLGADKSISLTEDTPAGAVIKIVLQANDAAAEEVSFTTTQAVDIP